MTFAKTTLSITILNITTPSITTLSIISLDFEYRVFVLILKLNLNETDQN
jgi:hypothetical protein